MNCNEIIDRVDNFGITNYGTGKGDPFVVILSKHGKRVMTSDSCFKTAINKAWYKLQDKLNESSN